MADYEKLSVEELGTGLAQTKNALARGQELIDKVAAMGAQKPAVWAALADSTSRLRQSLERDLDALQKALDQHLA